MPDDVALSADERAELSVAGHVEELLLPLLRSIGEPAAVVGYCLGGTMAIAAANWIEVERLVTLAAPALASTPLAFTWEGHKIVGTVDQVGATQVIKGRDLTTEQLEEKR